jgi:LCP family protein required for cell wall assembly
MPPSRDEDLDWLYGRDGTSKSNRPAPEPTKVMPAPPSSPSGYRQRPATDPPPSYSPPPVPPTAAAGAGGAGGPDWGRTSTATARPRKRRSGGRTVFRVLLTVLLLFVVWLIAVPVYAWSQVTRVDAVPPGKRPADQPGKTFLLVGSDSREGLSKAEQKKLGTGSTAGKRTDTIMIVYVPRGGKPALISLPRDSYVPIPGHSQNKINAAYSFGGPQLLVQTVEQSTGLRVDGYAEIGFGGFVSIVDAVDGVRMCLPSAIKDRDSHLDLKKGCQTLDGINALGYVRMRKADPRGDLGRVERQRAVLGAVAKKAATPMSVLNPVRYWNLCTSAAEAVRLGEDTSFAETVSLANAMRKIAGGQGLTLTVPVANPGAFTPVGSAVLWDTTNAKAMFGDIARGDTSKLSKYAK